MSIFNFHNSEKLPNPKSWKQEVLLKVIQKGEVSMMDFPYLAGFRTRVSELSDEGVQFVNTKVERKSKYGNQAYYVVHKCTNRNFAIQLYKRLSDDARRTKGVK